MPGQGSGPQAPKVRCTAPEADNKRGHYNYAIWQRPQFICGRARHQFIDGKAR